MIPQFQKKSNRFIIIWLMAKLGGFVISVVLANDFGILIQLLGSVCLIIGCVYYAKAKGYSGWWGFLGLLSLLGLIILACMMDRCKDTGRGFCADTVRPDANGRCNRPLKWPRIAVICVAVFVLILVAFVIVINIVMSRVGLEKMREKALYGDASAQFEMGWHYANGSGVEKNLRKACEWYHMAAEQGNPSAQLSLAMFYEYGGEGVEKNDALAFEWYLKLAERGNAHAQEKIARMYAQGRGVEKDESLAREWFRKSANKRNESVQRE